MRGRPEPRDGIDAGDPRRVLERLLAICWRAGRRLEREARDDASSAVVRRCAIELSLLADACGSSLSGPLLLRSTGEASPAEVLARYRHAVRAPLPRAIQAVLRDHVVRLERCLAVAPRAGVGSLVAA